jgi:hypothetical protein
MKSWLRLCAFLLALHVSVDGIDFKAESMSGALTDFEPGVAFMMGESYPLRSGTQVGVGDFNGDGFDDMFTISADEQAGNAGLQRLYCIFGRPEVGNLPKHMADVDGVNGFVVTSIMHATFTVGDINGDGKAGVCMCVSMSVCVYVHVRVCPCVYVCES